jgi:ABC transport system ATP-binding/permease protein
MLIVPQVLFSGALLPIPTLNPVGQALTAIMPSRWAFEALTTQGGHGKMLVADACWKLPKEQRDALTEEQKNQCTCMGANIFKKCDFPGIRSYYDPAVDQPEPIKPDEPVLPDPPIGINVLTALPQYQSDLTKLLTDYRERLQTYQTDYTSWKEAHSKAIASAEARLEVEYDNFSPIYNVNIVSHWLILLLITGVLTVIILIIQKIKDVL